MTNTIHNWAKSMLDVINATRDETIDGGIGGLGSQDGVYVSIDDVDEIIFKLEEAGYASYAMGMHIDASVLVHHSDCETRGLLISRDDEFPAERVLTWYDEATF